MFEYKIINDFIFLRDPLLEEIIYNYDYIVRTVRRQLIKRQLISGDKSYQVEKATTHIKRQLISIKTHRKLKSV